MLNLPTNIDKPERIVRAVIGAILILGGLVGAGPIFMFIIGVLLIAEAALSYCGIIQVWTMMGQKGGKPPSATPPPSTGTTPPSPPPTSTDTEEKK